MSNSMGLCVAVCLCPAREMPTGDFRTGSLDLRALEMALSLTSKPYCLSADAVNRESLAPYFGLGATRITAIPQSENAANVADILANALSPDLPQIILAGANAECGLGSGTVPYQLAERLLMPVVPNIMKITTRSDDAVVVQAMPWGKRRLLEVKYPFVATVAATAPEPRGFSHRRAAEGQVDGSFAAVREPNPEFVSDRRIHGQRTRPLSSHALVRFREINGEQSDTLSSRTVTPATGEEGAELLIKALRDQRVLPATYYR